MSSSIPIVPNSDRISTASLSASVGPVTVGFPVFGGADDLSVFVDGMLIDPADWTLTSFSGLNVAADILPAGDGRVTFDNAQTGDVEIIGEIKPARTAQLTPGVGVPAESHNLALSKIWAAIREIYSWGKAAIKLEPGDRAAALPGAAARAGKVLSFSDPGGNPEASISVGDIANAAGYASYAATAANNAQQAEAVIIALMAAADFTYFDSGVPNDAFGSNGDVYVNTAHARWSVYGPKAGGAWGSIVGYMFGEDGVGTGDVSAASNFGADNRVIRSDGTGKGVQATGITVSDNDVISGVSFENTALKVQDTDASHTLAIKPGTNLTGDRTLTIATGDANRTLDISAADVTVSSFAATLLDDAAPLNALTTLTARGQGKETIWIPASAMIARTTNGAAAGTAEMTTNKNMVKTLDFDASTQEFAQFEIAMPKSWNNGTVTFQPVWSHASTTTNFGVVLALQAVATSDDDALDVAFGTEQTSTDTGGTTNDRYIGPESSAITIAGTPATGDVVQFQIKRNPSDGSDTLAVDARLHGIKLYITTNAATDA